PALRREQKADLPQTAKANVDDDSAISVATRATPKRDQAGDAPGKTSSSNDPAPDAAVPVPQPVDLPADKSAAQKQPRGIAHMTGMRHWSTPDYTRVAIDLEQEVEYQSGRVPHPDRIFFDLHNTKLTSDLVGKSFDVGSGFLHRIRVAQYSANMARVVLDVD